jgi:phage tail sheath protein FI
MAGLLEIQRALLAMCAARGDLFAVLSLPGHFREQETKDYMAALFARPGAGEDDGVVAPPLPERAWSFGAVYHPWIVGAAAGPRADATLMPPDGAICGVFARRAIGRGAWVAPANESLNGIVALAPRISRSSWQPLQGARVNVIRHEPRGFLAFSADTLSDEPDYRHINVRRLLILLRRYAMARGMRHVFEPNSGAFRRRVQADFETMLGSLFSRGAFAGETPRTAFQVVTDGSVNTNQGIDAGRIVVELRVAPSLPMRFLTVRLLHAADRALALAEG